MEKFKFILVIVFSVLTLLSINSKGSPRDKSPGEKINLENQLENDSCIANELHNCITSYINESNSLFPESTQVIYTAYFFEKDGKDYFSIWGNYILPYYIESHNPSKAFNYTLFTINNRNIILINKTDTDKPKLYNLCSDKTGKDKVDTIKKKDSAITYDGPSFPKTYEYYLENGTYIITGINSMYFDFLGDDFLKYGKLVKE